MKREYRALVAEEEETAILQNDKNYSPSDTVLHLIPKA
jgi:hypothetical protein